MGGWIGGTRGDGTFLEPKKVPKKAACDVKAAEIKLEGDAGFCGAGKSLRCLVWSKLRPVIPSLFPFGRATHALRPAALSAATGAWMDAENRRGGWQ